MGLCRWFPVRDREPSCLIAHWLLGGRGLRLPGLREGSWRGGCVFHPLHGSVSLMLVRFCFLKPGSTSWWKPRQWSETSTTVAHVVTHRRNPKEITHYKTICLTATNYQIQHFYFQVVLCFFYPINRHAEIIVTTRTVVALGLLVPSCPFPLSGILNFMMHKHCSAEMFHLLLKHTEQLGQRCSNSTQQGRALCGFWGISRYAAL